MLMGLLLLIFTTKHKDPPPQLKKYVKGLMPTYWKVFNNNNDKLLSLFFEDNFLMELWRKWCKEDPEYLSILSTLDSRGSKLI